MSDLGRAEDSIDRGKGRPPRPLAGERRVAGARLGSPRSRAASTPAEDRPIDLNALVEPYRGAAVIGLVVVALVLLGIVIVQARRISRLGRRLDGLTRDGDGRSLEAILDAHIEKVVSVGRDVDRLVARSAEVEADGHRALQWVGLVRFNPFEDTGGNQSFALALTDAYGDGFVFSSLHSRTGTRLYAKPVTGGRAEVTLSAEEAEALRVALSRPAGRAANTAPDSRDRARVSV